MNLRQGKYESAAESGRAALANERGIVMIVVLLMLLLLTILGSTVLTSSITEIRLAGNFRNQQQAFFTAQGALEHAPVAAAVASAMNYVNEQWTGTIAFNGGNIVVTTGATAAPGAQNTAQVTAELVASMAAPRGSGSSAEAFVANYYDVDVVGMGPNNSEVEIISEVYKLQAKPE